MSLGRFPSAIVAWLEPRPVVRAALVFALSLGVLAWLVGPPPLHEDTARDLLIARDCVDAGLSGMAGPRASFGGITQGAIWIHVLEACRALGFGLHAARGLVLVLLAAAATFVSLVPRRMCGSDGGPAAWALYLALSVYCIELPVLWNPSMLPLPLALFYVCLLSLAAFGEARAALAAGAALALSIDAHAVCAALVPLLVVVVVAAAERPVRATALALLAAVATSWASSRGALHDDLPILEGAGLAAGVALVAAAGLGAFLRARVLARPPALRARAVLVASCAYFGLVMLALRVATGHPLAPRYFAALVPAAAVAGGAWLTGAWAKRAREKLRTQRANAVVVASTLLVALAVSTPHPNEGATAAPRWSAFDAETLARSLYAEGWTYAGLVRHLRGPDAERLVAGLAPYGPATRPEAPAPLSEDLVVAKVARSRLPAKVPSAWGLVDLGGGMVAVTRRASSWLDPSALEICEATAADKTPRCGRTGLGTAAGAAPAKGTFGERAYPTLAPLHEAFASDDAKARVALEWSVKIVVHATSETHLLTLVDRELPWRIERVDGLRRRGAVPGPEVTLDGPGTGSITFAVNVPPAAVEGFRRWLPGYVETGADETALRALVQGRTP